MKLLAEIRADEEIVEILTGKNASELDAVEVLANFTQYIKSNRAKFYGIAKIFGLKLGRKK